MATPLRGLCLILLLEMTGSRPAPGVRRESPNSSPYWNQASLDLQRRAILRRNAGDYAGAARVYQEGFDEARRLNDSLAAVKFLISIGGCQLLDFRYREATATFLEARARAASIGDREDAGAIAVNLANVYQQVWDFPAALAAAEAGLAGAPRDSYFMPQLLLTLGRLQASTLGSSRTSMATRPPGAGENAEAYFTQSIEAARAAGNVPLEALAWDLLGEQRLESGQLVLAGQALGEAYRLRLLARPSDLGYSYGLLGALSLARRDLRPAEHFTAMAIHAAEKGAPAWPVYRLRHQRGEILLARGHIDEALAEFSSAIDEAAKWRAEVVPARSTLTGANIGIHQRIFRSFIQTAAHQAILRGNTLWKDQAFLAVEADRAASLRETLALRDVWKEKLPPEYWEILGRLGKEQARLALHTASTRGRSAGSTASTSESTERLSLALTEMEAQAGIRIMFKKGENFRTQTSLNHFQTGLGKSDLFLSFALGETESYLWAVSRDSVRLVRIAGEKELASDVRAFQESVRTDAPDTAARGKHLYRMLFGQLSGDELGKRAWLLSVEGSLFELPFAALVVDSTVGHAVDGVVVNGVVVDGVVNDAAVDDAGTGDAGRSSKWTNGAPERGDERFKGNSAAKTVYLVERHSLQFVPGATLLSPPGDRHKNGGLLLAVGDPIYNSADPRWKGASGESPQVGRPQIERLFPGWQNFKSWLAPAMASPKKGDSAELPRLVGSSREVAAVAHSWRLESGTAEVLEGARARRDAFRGLLDRHPAVIHLATHVVGGGRARSPAAGGNQTREQSFIAFGIAASAPGQTPAAEFLSTAEIGGLHVPGALVAMTGCDTGAGDAEAGAGLLGLSRAWLLAGAQAVIATSWPVEDSGGDIFSHFYRRMPYEGAAEALRLSQVEMAHSETWRGKPSYWASYLLVGGGR